MAPIPMAHSLAHSDPANLNLQQVAQQERLLGQLLAHLFDNPDASCFLLYTTCEFGRGTDSVVEPRWTNQAVVCANTTTVPLPSTTYYIFGRQKKLTLLQYPSSEAVLLV
jgi:hypothetical protein